jgi:FkbM family methyltransferase
VSYSQYDEEGYIVAACHDATVRPSSGRFLDIGAWSAKDFSNTRALYELGWSGVMIEPSPGPMLGLLKEYGNDPRITLVQGAVTCEPGLIALHVTDDAVTTSNECEFEKWKDTAKFHGKMTVPGIPLDYIARQYGGFDFVNIDAEGISADLLLQALRLGWQPGCICVEHERREGEIIAAATPLHYHVVYGNGTNMVLRRG